MKSYINISVIDLAALELIREGKLEATVADILVTAEKILQFAEKGGEKRRQIRFRKNVIEISNRILNVGDKEACMV